MSTHAGAQALGKHAQVSGSPIAFKQKKVDQNRTIIKEVISKLVEGTSSTAQAAQVLGQLARVLRKRCESARATVKVLMQL